MASRISARSHTNLHFTEDAQVIAWMSAYYLLGSKAIASNYSINEFLGHSAVSDEESMNAPLLLNAEIRLLVGEDAA